MSEVRVLNDRDQAALIAFLEPRLESSLFLVANSEAAGLVDHDAPVQGTYVASFSGGRITAVAAHYWNGNVVVQGDEGLEEAARMAVRESGRAVAGLIGPLRLGERVRRALGAEQRATKTDSADLLYALNLNELRIPEQLTRSRISCRSPTPEESEGWLIDWRVSYCVETLGDKSNDTLRAQARELLARLGRLGWVLLDDQKPVAYSTFNAQTHGVVQIGGVFTPRELRGRGYGRAVVAASLLDARRLGATRSVLFTSRENLAAQRAYEALGYRAIDDFMLVLFE